MMLNYFDPKQLMRLHSFYALNRRFYLSEIQTELSNVEFSFMNKKRIKVLKQEILTDVPDFE